jgi:hypothetical protein
MNMLTKFLLKTRSSLLLLPCVGVVYETRNKRQETSRVVIYVPLFSIVRVTGKGLVALHRCL